jgi:hypothetical protein
VKSKKFMIDRTCSSGGGDKKFKESFGGERDGKNWFERPRRREGE